jgi:signal transduction histidine kinase/CheY-like chemotaxis protein
MTAELNPAGLQAWSSRLCYPTSRQWLYGLAPVALMFVVRWQLEPVLEDKSPFLLFTLAVMLAAAYGGVWIGGMATLIGGIAGLSFLAGPSRDLDSIVRSGRWLQPVLYLLVCGAVTYLIEILHRLRRRAEANAAEQSRLARELAKVNTAKDEFLAVLSHELRTPLSAIVGWAHVLRTGKPGAIESTRAVEAIHRNAMVQKQLIADILDVGRITSGKLRLDSQMIDPSVVVAAAIETIRPAAHAKEVGLAVEVQAGTLVWADPDRLQQVIWNLLSNAIKFTPASGLITVRLAEETSRVRITVADTGPGLRPEFIPHAFERFSQDDAFTWRSHRGLGLGLAIVRQLVELLGGTVTASNRLEGPGALFEVALPRMMGSAFTIAKHARPSTGERDRMLAGVRVLLVDHESEARNVLAWTLQAFGAEVATAQSASDAVETLEKGSTDVVLTEIAMPEQDGYDLLRTIRSTMARRGKVVPAAVITASADERERARALEAGFQFHMTKPVDPDELAAAIRRMAAR